MRNFIDLLEVRRFLSAGDQDIFFGDQGFLRLRFGETAYQFLPGSDPTGAATIISMNRNANAFSVETFNAGILQSTITTNPLPFQATQGLTVTPRRTWSLSGGRTLVEFIVPFPQGDSLDASYLVRLNGDKTLDTTYGKGGRVVFVLGFGNQVAQQDNNLIVITGVGGEDLVKRLTADGEFDSTFGDTGIGINPPNPAKRLLVQSDGKIVVAVDFFSSARVYRYTPDGLLDMTFGGGDGIAVGTRIGDIRAMAFDSSGRIVVSGLEGLTRFSPGGLLDTTFGINGLAVPLEDPFNGGTEGEAVLSDGTLLAPFGLRHFVRVKNDGSFDAALGRVDVELFALDPVADSRLSNTLTHDAQTASAQDDGSILISRRFADGRFSQVRIEGGGTSPGPIQLSSGTLSVAGTDQDDSISITGDITGTTALLNHVGRTLSSAGVNQISADGAAGNDLIKLRVSFAPVPSSLSGGDGNDSLIGSSGSDSLSGNAGKDVLNGNDGNDRVAGNGGRDVLYGGSGDDRIFGGAGGDWLRGEYGADQFFGEGGNDRLCGDTAGDVSDTIHGNAGDDIFFSVDSVVDHLFGDGGRDRANSDTSDRLTSIEKLL